MTPAAPEIPAAPDAPALGLRAPRLVVLATVTFVALCGLWSVLTPLAEAPDEPAHYGLVLHVADTGDYPAHDELHHTDGMFQICVDYAVSALWCRTSEERADGVRMRDRPVDEAPAKDDRPYWDDPEFAHPVGHRLNQMPQHPPLYYQAMAAAVRVERTLVPGEMSADTELAYLRLLNVLLLAPLPWLAWWLARRLGAGDEVGTVAALVPLAVPQLTHIGATLNNDNLFVLFTSVLMALLAGVVRGDRSIRTAVLVGIVTGLALLTKGFGFVLPPVVVLAYWIGSANTPKLAPKTPEKGAFGANFAVWRSRIGPAARGGLVALGVGLLVCGWWYWSKWGATGKLMPSIEDSRLNPVNRLPGVESTLDTFVQSTVSRLVMGFWGAFGWRRVELPMAVSTVATALCVAAAAQAFRREARSTAGDDRDLDRDDGVGRPPIPRAALLLLLTPVILLGVFVVVRAAVIYYDTGRLAFQQGRYLFGSLVATATVVAVGARHLLRARAVPVAVGAVVAMQTLGIAWCLDGWWDVSEVGAGDALRAVVAWSGWPDPVVVILLALAPLLLLVLVAETRSATRHGRGVGQEEPPVTPLVDEHPDADPDRSDRDLPPAEEEEPERTDPEPVRTPGVVS